MIEVQIKQNFKGFHVSGRVRKAKDDEVTQIASFHAEADDVIITTWEHETQYSLNEIISAIQMLGALGIEVKKEKE